MNSFFNQYDIASLSLVIAALEDHVALEALYNVFEGNQAFTLEDRVSLKDQCSDRMQELKVNAPAPAPAPIIAPVIMLVSSDIIP